ncbi:MAG: NADPH-dependent FMN reductase [Saprospiraceae bacterium]
MKKIIAIAGSNSKNSINKKLVIYVTQQINDADISIFDMNDFDLPIYGIDEELENGFPKDAQGFNSKIEGADGIILSLPEHNGSYTTAFKNAYDWLSRIDKIVWKNKPMLLMSTAPGGRGGASVMQAAKTGFPYMGGNIIADFSLPFFNDNFDNGVTNEEFREDLMGKVGAFMEAID